MSLVIIGRVKQRMGLKPLGGSGFQIMGQRVEASGGDLGVSLAIIGRVKQRMGLKPRSGSDLEIVNQRIQGRDRRARTSPAIPSRIKQRMGSQSLAATAPQVMANRHPPPPPRNRPRHAKIEAGIKQWAAIEAERGQGVPKPSQNR